MLVQGLTDLIGNTPLVHMNRLAANLPGQLYAKLEMMNPAGSAKDRVAREMIEDAERQGVLKTGATIIEPTSGNTGIGIASVACAKGYKVILTMPETMSLERRNLLAAYGAKLVLTEGSQGMQGSVDKANELVKEIPGAVILGQFVNPANPMAHYKTTGPEIMDDLNGQVDVFIAGMGTGGTITGTARYLKEKNPNVRIIAIEPADSPLLTKGVSGPHKLQGIGANFIPEIYDNRYVDEVRTVTTEQAYRTAKELVQSEGLLTGITSGATLYVGLELAKEETNRGKNIVALLPDTGERYLSTGMFDS